MRASQTVRGDTDVSSSYFEYLVDLPQVIKTVIWVQVLENLVRVREGRSSGRHGQRKTVR